jgi:hypothetical protein
MGSFYVQERRLDGNVSGPTLRSVEEIIERYKAERWPEPHPDSRKLILAV